MHRHDPIHPRPRRPPGLCPCCVDLLLLLAALQNRNQISARRPARPPSNQNGMSFQPLQTTGCRVARRPSLAPAVCPSLAATPPFPDLLLKAVSRRPSIGRQPVGSRPTPTLRLTTNVCATCPGVAGSRRAIDPDGGSFANVDHGKPGRRSE
jgi:hypothetical protein